MNLKLDLTKAMEIQSEVAKKLIEKHNNKDGQNKAQKDEKSEQLEVENNRIMKALQAEFASSRVLKYDNIRLRNLNDELLLINKALVEANKSLQARVGGMQQELDSFRSDHLGLIRSLDSCFESKGQQPSDSSVMRFLETFREKKNDLLRQSRDLTDWNSPNEKRVTSRLRGQRDGASSRDLKMQMVSHMNTEVQNLKLVQKVQRGTVVPPLGKTNDPDSKAWSHRDHNHEQLEEQFDTRRENLESSLVLDPSFH